MTHSQNDPLGSGFPAGRKTQTVCTGFTRAALASSSPEATAEERAGESWLDQAVAITTFPRVTNVAGSPVLTTWHGLVELLSEPLRGYTDKADLPLWAPAEFAGHRRARENVQRVHALGFDDDQGGTWDEALAVWQDFAGILHTSWSDSDEKPARRAVLALSRPVSADEYEGLWRWLAGLLVAGGHAVGPEAKDSSRQWFRPALRPGGRFRSAVLPGEPFDVDEGLAEVPAPRPAPGRKPARSGGPVPRSVGGLGATVVERLADLGTVAALLGADPPRSARGGSVPCPFHEESAASFSLFPASTGGWAGRCHSVRCGAKGSALYLIGRRLGITRQVAVVEEVGRLLGIPTGLAVPELDQSVQDRAHQVLLAVAPLSRAARDYLVGRGFQDDEIPLDWAELPAPDEQAGVVRALIEELGVDDWRLSGLADENDPTRFAHDDHRLVVPWYAGPGVLAPVALIERVRLAEGAPTSVLPRGKRPPLPFGAVDLDEIAGPDTVLVLVAGALAVVAVRALAREHGLDWFPVGLPDGAGWQSEWADLARGRDVVVGLADDDEAAAVWVDLEAAGARTIARRAPRAGTNWLDTLRDSRGEVGAG